MLDIPFEKNRGNACALSSYAMVGRSFFPEITFKQIAEISDWHKGYLVWGFRFWLWIMDKGIKITNYDLIDLNAWAKNGIDILGEGISKEELEIYKNKTYKVEEYSEVIKKVLAHSNFIFKRERPTWEDLEKAFQRGAVCEVVLDCLTLDEQEKSDKISLHRVIVLDITDKEIVFHDPRTNKPRPKRKESIELFKKAWLERLNGPELCIYERI
jgi:hypothetical protein